MANVNAPNGFQIWRRLDGGSPTAGFEVRKIVSTYNVAVGYGDPVIPVASGYIQRATASTVQIEGIFFGCSYYSSVIQQTIFTNYWPGTTQGSDATVYLCTDPQMLFVAQSNNTAITFADIGANIQHVIGTPDTVTGFSTSALDQSTIATTDTLPWRIVGLLSEYETATGAVNGTDNASAYNRVIVAPNYWSRRSLLGIV